MATGDVLNILIISIIISFLSSYSSKQTALNVFDNPNIYIYIYIYIQMVTHIGIQQFPKPIRYVPHFFPEGI